MAAIKQNQLKDASEFMGAIWSELIKPFYNPENTDQYWSELVEKENELIRRFDLSEKNRLLLEMMFGFTCGLEMKAGNERRTSYFEKLLHM